MKLTVFGATGRIGGFVVRQALDAGHTVTAVVRDAAKFEISDPALEVFVVNGLTDPGRLIPALKGADAAISGIGPVSRKDLTVASTTTRGILQALQETGARRFVAVSASPVGPIPEGESWLNRRFFTPLVSTLLRGIYADLAVMEREIARSGLDWTVVRPPRLLDGPLTGRYRMVIGGNVPRGPSISRLDAAHAMLAVLANPATIGQPVGIAS